MGAIAILFWILVALIAAVAVLALIGLIQSRREAAKGKKDPASREAEMLSDKTVENVLDLNDRFNRARYMDKDGG